MTRRLDLVMAVNRLLLENLSSSEVVLLQRLASLLADRLATWVLVDVEDGGVLRRDCVAGPDEEDSVARSQAALAVNPAGSLPGEVAAGQGPVLLAHAEDDTVLGVTQDGVPLLLLLRGASAVSVPILADGVGYGALTLVRAAGQGVFGLADTGVVQEAAEQLGRALASQRMIRRRTETAESLQANLLPRELRPVPGARIAAAHLAPTQGSEVGGDFYDVYPTPDGRGLAIGEVCGRDRDAAAVTSAARHAIRVLAHWDADPGAVLRGANDILLAEAFDGSFVTADAAHLSWRDGSLRVVLGSAGHPGPVLLTADGRAQLVEGGGVPLGVFGGGDVDVVLREIVLAPGDLLFFYTDGLTGARGGDQSSFGDHLVDCIADLAGPPPAELLAGLRNVLLDFCGGVLLDDVTMLALLAAESPD